MKSTYWVILIGILAWLSLYVVSYVSHGIGSAISGVFKGTAIEQTGNAIFAFGDLAFSAFILMLIMALVVICAIIYIRIKVASPN